MTNFNQQVDKIKNETGFIAALDQNGGSTSKALANYGVNADAYSNDDEMFNVVHQIRTRIMTSPAFTGEHIMVANLLQNTMDRKVEGQRTADYLWNTKCVVPFFKVGKGLANEANGAQVMKPIPVLDDLLQKARHKNVFGTKMRPVIKTANADGVQAVVAQQFDVGYQITAAGLASIIESEVKPA